MAGGFTRKLLSLIVLVAGVAAAQTVPPRKDIPTIAKAANGAIVSIVMSDKSGKPIAQGSGFLVGKDGVIITNYHVIAEGISAVVKLPDGAFYVVDGVLASDKTRDVAIINAHGKNFRTLSLGNSDRIQVGEEVVAIGNPLSFDSTVSNGIVSAIRTIEDEGGQFLQITTPISPGSSGGPLFNMAGDVIGITTLKIKGGENLNFAIPINDAKLLLQKRSAKLQDLPNEVEKETQKETHAEASPTPPVVGQISDSSAYQQYQELLKAGDLKVTTGLYACFYDSKEERTKNFFVIGFSLLTKHDMQAYVRDFTDGVEGDTPLYFEGKVQSFSSERAIYAHLPASPESNYSLPKSQETDVFHWTSGDVAIEAGFGRFASGEFAYRLKMQHSTGRFVEDIATVHETGKCIRIPNSQTPEEEYKFTDN